MEYHIKHNKREHRFEVSNSGYLAFVEYQLLDNQIMNIYHTVVPEAIESKGIGSSIMKEALDFARRNHYQVLPTCAFAQAYLIKHPDYRDILIKR